MVKLRQKKFKTTRMRKIAAKRLLEAPRPGGGRHLGGASSGPHRAWRSLSFREHQADRRPGTRQKVARCRSTRLLALSLIVGHLI
jgi:hypothetical protein